MDWTTRSSDPIINDIILVVSIMPLRDLFQQTALPCVCDCSTFPPNRNFSIDKIIKIGPIQLSVFLWMAVSSNWFRPVWLQPSLPVYSFKFGLFIDHYMQLISCGYTLYTPNKKWSNRFNSFRRFRRDFEIEYQFATIFLILNFQDLS